MVAFPNLTHKLVTPNGNPTLVPDRGPLSTRSFPQNDFVRGVEMSGLVYGSFGDGELDISPPGPPGKSWLCCQNTVDGRNPAPPKKK